MKRFLILTTLCSMIFCYGADDPKIVTRTDYDISPFWQPKVIQGKDFWRILCARFSNQGRYWQGMILPGVFRPLDSEVESIRNFSKYPAFANSGMSVEPAFQIPQFDNMKDYNTGKVFTVQNILGKEEHLSADAPFKRSQPMLIRDWAPRPFPFKLTAATYKYDKAEEEAWLKKHPNFLTFDMGEWDNEYINLAFYLDIYSKLKKIDAATAQTIQKDFPKAATKDQFVARMKKAFERKSSLYFGDPSRLSFMHAGWNVGHLAAYWGAGMITLETSNSGGGDTYYRWQVGMSFARGAARQYSIPWMWYIASCINGYTAAGKWVSSYEPGFDSNNGVGPSWLKRCFYLAYFSGANLMELEHWYLKVLAVDKEKPKNYKLSRIGKHYVEFSEFASANPDRGVAYTPIALLTPFNQGYPQWGGNGFSSAKPYTRNDFALDAFWATIVPAYDRDPALRRGEQGALFNSPYGDLFDVIIPDAPEHRNLAEVLSGYKAAIITGDIKVTPELTNILLDYVKNGGTLLLHVGQLNSVIPAKTAGLHVTPSYVREENHIFRRCYLDGATALKKNKDNVPLLTLKRLGKGSVVVACADSWVPNMNAKSISETRRGILKFPYIQDVLTRLTAQTIPFKVKGDIQYGLNKTKDGWIVYLINNRGVTKMADTAEKVDPAAVADVTVSWDSLLLGKCTELRTAKEVAISNNAVQVKVLPGDVTVLRFKNK
ncbi:MAG: hypothetical protein J6W81_02295 [Lentisphaeria bacterium]|nr:hypothetical protein [Lentisphaeria bacterium]